MEEDTLQLLSDEEFSTKIKNNLSDYISDPKFIDNLKLRISGLPLSVRDQFKHKIVEAVKLNNQSISSALITEKGLRLPPTISNWLKDYDLFVGEDDQQNKEDYIKSSRFTGLTDEDRNFLLKLFDLYNLLKPESEISEELDKIVVKDKSGKLKIFEKGGFIELSIPSPREIKPAVAKAPARSPETPKKIEEKKPVASFYFHPEDEEDIRGHKKAISAYGLSETLSINDIIKKIIAANNITFSDDIIEKRFETIARARLKEIRKAPDTLDILTRSKKIGGMEFSPTLAQKILDDLNREIPNLQKAKPAEIKKLEEFVPTPKEALEKAAEKTEKASLIERAEIKPAEIKIERPVPKATFEKPIPIAPKKEIKYEVPKPRIVRSRPVGGKPRLEDIKSKAKPLGPIEELKEMTLKDFRSLATDKASSVQKVYDKLNLLREDSFAKYSQGVKAWRGSEVYRLYLRMGQLSMDEAKTISEVANKLEKEDQPYLSEREFNFIADLNKHLRF